jgi:hypothetical protein
MRHLLSSKNKLIMDKDKTIKRAAFLLDQLESVEKDINKIKSLNSTKGSRYEQLANHTKVLSREDLIEANQMLIAFLTQRIKTKENNYIKEFESINITVN